MQKNIELEIRGRLSRGEYNNLKKILDKHGRHIESHEREMFLLRDYPGYSKDFVNREIDIRLRCTNGKSEIMLKKKAGNAREEISLRLIDKDLENAKKIAKAFGCLNAIWMRRLKEVYTYKGIEWSLVKAPPSKVLYYEAEMVLSDTKSIKESTRLLTEEAKKLGLEVLDDEGTRKLVKKLDEEANKLVDF